LKNNEQKESQEKGLSEKSNTLVGNKTQSQVSNALEEQGLSVSELANKSKDTVFYYEKAREVMESQGITDEWLIAQYKDIADNAVMATKEWFAIDYKAKLKAVESLSKMAKKTGSTESIASTIKAMMLAQWAKWEGSTFNFTKFIYGGNSQFD